MIDGNHAAWSGPFDILETRHLDAVEQTENHVEEVGGEIARQPAQQGNGNRAVQKAEANHEGRLAAGKERLQGEGNEGARSNENCVDDINGGDQPGPAYPEAP